ncbi:hypothetical protein [Wolbachia endosymbiont of Cantharis cryptica]
MKEAAKGLQELGQKPDAGNQSIGINTPGYTPSGAEQEKDGPQIGG